MEVKMEGLRACSPEHLRSARNSPRSWKLKRNITFAISSSIVLHAVLNSLFNFPFNSLRKAHNSQQAELA